MDELSGKSYGQLRCTYRYDNNTNEMVLLSGDFEDTKEIYFSSYSTSSGQDFTNNLTRSYVVPVVEGMQLTRILKNNVFDTFICTFADKNKKVVYPYTGSLNSSPYIVTVPEGAVYMTIRTGIKNAQPNTEYRDNVMICVLGTAQEFENPTTPQKTTYTPTLRGIPVSSGGNYTDENNQQWICDTIEKYADGSGKYIQRIIKLDFDGTEVWANDNYMRVVSAELTNCSVSNATDGQTSLFSAMTLGTRGSTTNSDDVYVIANNKIYASPTQNGTRLTNEQWKTYLANNNATFLYATTQPTETPLTALQLSQLNLSTYYPITNISSESGVTVEYICDTKNYIDNKYLQIN